jgi:uncharacterized DUF497 family protein
MAGETEAELYLHPSGFEWDENKRRANLEKHGLDFNDARDAFLDPRQFTYRSAHSRETRYVTVGAVRGLLVAVISTPRRGMIRIISVRAARRSERTHYG